MRLQLTGPGTFVGRGEKSEGVMPVNCLVDTRKRGGVTLVEILVTLGIFAISFGLLLPAIQQARESARFRQCQNHLRQVGLATVAHEAARSQLPAGTLGYAAAINRDDFRHRPTGPYWRKVPHTSFWVQLLPYLNQEIQSAKLHAALTRRGESLHNARNQDGALVNWFGQADGLAELSTRSIDVLHCPSDSLRDQTTPIRLAGGSQPVTNDGSNDRMDFLDDVGSQMTGALVASNYLACAGAHSGGIPADPQRLHFRGAMSSGETMVLSKITDGTSNSLLAGETIGR